MGFIPVLVYVLLSSFSWIRSSTPLISSDIPPHLSRLPRSRELPRGLPQITPFSPLYCPVKPNFITTPSPYPISDRLKTRFGPPSLSLATGFRRYSVFLTGKVILLWNLIRFRGNRYWEVTLLTVHIPSWSVDPTLAALDWRIIRFIKGRNYLTQLEISRPWFRSPSSLEIFEVPWINVRRYFKYCLKRVSRVGVDDDAIDDWKHVTYPSIQRYL